MSDVQIKFKPRAHGNRSALTIPKDTFFLAQHPLWAFADAPEDKPLLFYRPQGNGDYIMCMTTRTCAQISREFPEFTEYRAVDVEITVLERS